MKRGKHQDLIALSLAGIMAVGISVFFPLGSAYQALRGGAYFFCAALLVLFLVLLVSYVIRMPRPALRWPRGSLIAIVVITVVHAIQLVNVPNALRVMDDEGAILATALAFYEEKELYAADKGYWINGEFEIVAATLDKRPFFYAFLISLVHGLSGYQLENAFILNGALSLLSLWLAYGLLSRWCGVLPACIGVVFLAITPVFISSANGAGFEMLNLFLLVLLAHAVDEYLRTRSDQSAVILCLVAVLLSYARYESVIFTLPVGILILIDRFKRPDVGLHPILNIVPFLLVPYVWLYRCTLSRVGAWARAEEENLPVFSISYIPENFYDAVRFFFSFEPLALSNPVLSYLGIIGLILAFWQLVPGAAHSGPQDFSRLRVNLLFWVGLFSLLSLTLLNYFWSSFMDVISQRMSLPYLLVLLFGLVWVLRSIQKWPSRLTVLLLVSTIPLGIATKLMSRERVEGVFHSNRLAVTQTAKLDWFKSNALNPDKVLFVDDNPVIWTALRVPAIQWSMARMRQEQLSLHDRLGTFERIYCVQLMHKGPSSGKWKPSLGQSLDRFELAETPELQFDISASKRLEMRAVTNILPGGKAAYEDLSAISTSDRILSLP